MPDPKPYTITQVVETVRPDAQGRLMPMTRVAFTMPNGYAGEVTIPRDQATPEAVKTLIEAEVKRVSQLYAL